MVAAAQRITPVKRIEQAVSRDTNDSRPTEIRYGWCPFKDINLVGSDGTMTLYVQPDEISDGGSGVVANPYHRILPKGQLIPFPTFNAIAFALSDEARDSRGVAIPVQTTRSATALENIVSVMRVYSGWGFTNLTSLQGLDQEMAGRIFQVVQPFDYLLRDIEAELEFGALDRIDSYDDIQFDLGDGEVYHVTALFSDQERDIARRLASEMLSAAGIAVTFATDVFDETIVSINNKLSGGQGKAGPDPLDRYVAAQLGREGEIPSVASRNGAGRNEQQAASTAALEQKIDYLVANEAARADKEEIARLKAEVDALKAGQSKSVYQAMPMTICGAVKANGEECRAAVNAVGEKCRHHQVEEV